MKFSAFLKSKGLLVAAFMLLVVSISAKSFIWQTPDTEENGNSQPSNLNVPSSAKYKCVAIYNCGEPWALDDIRYYIEFSDNGLTKWRLVDGEWKEPQWFDFNRKHDTGIVYLRKNYPLKGSSVYCTDHFEFSLDFSILKRYYRCPESPYEFDYVFKRIE